MAALLAAVLNLLNFFIFFSLSLIFIKFSPILIFHLVLHFQVSLLFSECYPLKVLLTACRVCHRYIVFFLSSSISLFGSSFIL